MRGGKPVLFVHDRRNRPQETFQAAGREARRFPADGGRGYPVLFYRLHRPQCEMPPREDDSCLWKCHFGKEG